MSDDYLPLLLASLQERIAKLEARMDSLEAETYQAIDEDEAVPRTYMDGTPIR
jgi:hypothetical protein